MVEIRMEDIIPLVGLPSPGFGKSDYYVSCPCCDDNPRKKHLNINLEKNVFRCPRCGFSGGVFDLYAYYVGVDRANARQMLLERMNLGDSYTVIPSRHRPTSHYKEETLCPATDIDARHDTYTALLSRLSLASDHRQNLLSRGLSLEAIERLEYKSTPVIGLQTIAKQLTAEGYYLAGVPGFYRTENDQWTFVRQSRGILIPVRDSEGRIQGLQIRRDNAVKRKFRWVSSTGKKDGCKAESWTHVTGEPKPEIILTEGPMKADVIAYLSGKTVLAVPGVNALTQLELTLEYLRERGTERIMTAFDMDMLTNPHVQKGYQSLVQLLDMLVDLGVGAWAPSPRYHRITDSVTVTAENDVEFMDGMERWEDALRHDHPIIVDNAESIRHRYPKEYQLYKRLHADSLLAVPYGKHPTGFLVVRNPKKHRSDSDMLRVLAFVCLSMLQIKELQTGIALMQHHTKESDDNLVEINLLGTPEITISMGSISQSVYKSQKGWRILVYLLLHRSTAVPAKDLVVNIWPDENDDTAPESIRGIVYRFKQKISFLSDEDLIINSANGYQINPACRIVTDLEQMEMIWENTQSSLDLFQKSEELKRALQLYRGDLFEDAPHEDWLMGIASRYHLLYLKIAGVLFETLHEMQDYTGIHDYAQEVLKIDRGNVETNYWLIYSLKKLGAAEQARRVFSSAGETMSTEEYIDLETRLAETLGGSDMEM